MIDYLWAAFAAYLLFGGALYLGQRLVLYRTGGVYTSLSEAGVDARLKEFPVTTEDGIHLKGWYAPATTKHLTLVLFHGNGDTLATVAHLAGPYIEAGYGFLVTEYRGYSGMEGIPTEAGLYADGRAYMAALKDKGVTGKSTIFYGQSLGTGIAVEMAAEFSCGGMILVSPFLSMGATAQYHYPFLPADFLTKDRYDNYKKVPKIHCPLLIAHGMQDNIVPFVQGKKLFDLAKSPKEFRSYPEGTHANIINPSFIATTLAWLQDRT